MGWSGIWIQDLAQARFIFMTLDKLFTFLNSFFSTCEMGKHFPSILIRAHCREDEMSEC